MNKEVNLTVKSWIALASLENIEFFKDVNVT